MRKYLLPLLLLVAGVGVGGGAGFAAMQVLGPPKSAGERAEGALVFAPTGKILAPLVFSDGRLTGYVAFEVELEVAPDKVSFIEARLPLLKHAVNMRTYRTPLASGPDGMLPNIEPFRKLVMDASAEAFGPGVVHRVAVTQAAPA